ncbi:MAG: aminotransferase class IV [Chitinophagales bacterium]
MKMTKNISFFKGEFIPFEDLRFKDFQRLRFADSLFESMLAVNGKVPLLDYHLKRLLHSCEYLQLDFPTIVFDDVISELLEKNSFDKYARLRLTVFRAEGKLYSPNGSKSFVLIEAEEYTKEFFQSINTIGVYSENKKPLTIYSLLKSGNALHYVIAKQFAQANNFDEVLIMNPNTEIIEAASNNVFYIHEGKIYTPSTSTGCVNGVMKKFLCEEIIENITYAACLQDDLERFDEIFLTNAVGLIQPVKQYGDKKYEHNITNSIIEKIKKRFELQL